MKTRQRKIADLNPAPYNPRKISDKQLADLSASLDKFGFQQPVIVNENADRKDIVVGGHQRLKAWAALGHKTVPTVSVDLSEAEERELNIRLNANTGDWDFEALAAEFGRQDLESWGDFGEDRLDSLFAAHVEPEAPEDFKDLDDDIDTDYKCPGCGYEWSGQAK